MSADVMLREPLPVRKFQPPGRALMTLEEYFAFADAIDFRVEYYDGEIFILGSDSPVYAGIPLTIVSFLWNQLAYPGYELIGNNVAMNAPHNGRCLPDLCFVRGEPEICENSNDLLNPVLVVDVNPPSTRGKDINTLLPEYRDMPTMEHILIVEQDRPFVQHHMRVDGEWTQRECTAMDDIVDLDSMDASISLAQIYRGVDFPQT